MSRFLVKVICFDIPTIQMLDMTLHGILSGKPSRPGSDDHKKSLDFQGSFRLSV